ncbi:uncharacterized protein LOC121764235 [Salvia splendens]|uniref:uncharacterized protein LOC121764235 n=1 Tax=Salvia splendens TaxID=180675 RepID=UPI001C268647|nr:uncharacterized protein LOC121764235 [Salvia splendens]
MEPFTQPNQDFYSKLLGLEFKAVNTAGKIWVFVKEGSSFEIIDDSEQVLHGLLTTPATNQPIAISAVYAKCTRAERYYLWSKIRDIAGEVQGRPWMIGGDFNTILSPQDRIGSDSNRVAEMVDFAEVVEECRLMDLGFDGSPFTWAKNALFERLDRVFINEQWTSVFESSRVSNLPRVASDHGPVLMRCETSTPRPQGKPFRFQNMWIRHLEFKGVVTSSWAQPTEAVGLLNFQVKLARLKKVLKRWNKEVFGNLHAILREAEERVVSAQGAYEADPYLINRSNINKHIAQYILLLKMEEDLWRQKEAVRWLKDGDRNTKFYQSWVKQKMARLRIHSVQVGDRVLTEESEVKASKALFIQDLLAPPTPPLIEPNLSLIQQKPNTTN